MNNRYQANHNRQDSLQDSLQDNLQDNLQDEDPVLTIKDLARRTRLSEGHIYQQAIAGAIEHYSFGGSNRKRGAIRFSERQLRQFLSNQLDHRQPVTGLPKSTINPANATRQPGTTTHKLNQLLKPTQKKRA